MLLEVAVAMPILLIALTLFAQMLIAGNQLRSGAHAEWAGSSAAQDLLEKMRNEDFNEVFRLYNADPFDDPAGAGTAPGINFSVPKLDPLDTDLDGMVGEVILPFWNAGTELSPAWQVREDVGVPALGMPRDLNGDSIIDDLDHAADYSFLPVIVRLSWRGLQGPRVFEIHTALSELR